MYFLVEIRKYMEVQCAKSKMLVNKSLGYSRLLGGKGVINVIIVSGTKNVILSYYK